ncbi:MbcA/ParS/Xre antitoxin family protein [Kumtagia ephedrae]|nr:MbcA/ParS/Xre antitoxin family protein [Mesorhizobium ephedrae]
MMTSRDHPGGFEESATPYLAPTPVHLPAGRAASLFGTDGMVDIDHVVERFGMSKGQFAETIGLAPETLRRTSRLTAAKTQSRITEMLEIIARVTGWAGGEKQAMAWYRAEPIPAFGGRTAESLVKDGKANAVRDYLDHVAMGGFA